MPTQMPTHDQNAQKQAQEQKCAEALRANLKRRKEQQHARNTEEKPDAKTNA